MTAKPQTESESIQAQIQAFVVARASLQDEWLGALADKSAAIHKGDSKRAEAASQTAAAKRAELIEATDGINKLIGPLREAIEAEFFVAMTIAEVDVAPLRRKIEELSLELRGLGQQEHRLTEQISDEVDRIAKTKQRAEGWLSDRDSENLAVVRRLFN